MRTHDKEKIEQQDLSIRKGGEVCSSQVVYSMFFNYRF